MANIKQVTNTYISQSKLPLVIGYFSCVHVMHSQLLSKYHDFNVLTFKDFYTKQKNYMYTYEQRLNNIKKYNPLNIYVFDLNRYNMTAQDFVHKVLMKINPSEIIVGSDFKFGSDKKGIDFLKKYFTVNSIKYNDKISTTRIVKDIKSLKLETANGLLDEPYYFEGKWVSGKRLGKKLGIRTINLKVNKNIVLPDGVYISQIKIANKTYNSVTFLGTSKTTGSLNRTLETHILDKKILPKALVPNFIKNNIRVSFLKYIRKVRQFPNGIKLVQQIRKDIEQATNYFKGNI